MNKLILISIPLFLIHAIEEYSTGFYNSDNTIVFLGKVSNIDPVLIFFLLQILLVAFLVFLLASKGRLRKTGVIIFGLVLLLELSHPVAGLIQGSYVPGLYTSLLILAIGIPYFYKSRFEFE